MAKLSDKQFFDDLKSFLEGCTAQPHRDYSHETKTYETDKSFLGRMIDWAFRYSVQDEAARLLKELPLHIPASTVADKPIKEPKQ